jgi:hypothetical protein
MILACCAEVTQGLETATGPTRHACLEDFRINLPRAEYKIPDIGIVCIVLYGQFLSITVLFSTATRYLVPRC